MISPAFFCFTNIHDFFLYSNTGKQNKFEYVYFGMTESIFHSAVNYKLFELKFKRMWLLVFSAVFFSLRLLSDYVLLFSSNLNPEIIYYWKFASSILIFGSVFIFIFSKNQKRLLKEKFKFKNYLRDMSFVALSGAGVGICKILFENYISKYKGESFFLLLLNEVLISAVIILSFIALKYVYKWLIARQHKSTFIYIKILSVFFVIFIAFEALIHSAGLTDKFNTALLRNIIIIIFAFAGFLSAKNNSWLAYQARHFKIFLTIISFAGLAVSFAIVSFSLSRETQINQFFTSFLPGGDVFIGAVWVLALVYSFRIFVSVLMSFPTSGIVERRTKELQSLSSLNRFIAGSVNSDSKTLLETFTKLANEAFVASGAWTEIYAENGETEIISTDNINLQKLKNFNKNENLKGKFKELKEPALISTVAASKEMENAFFEMPFARSMIAVPIFSGEKKLGTLYVVKSKEFAFENDDLKTLTAFSDNISIALENRRLFHDSLEKEHYKRELELAREIQTKLLPKELPTIERFSIAALFKPAEEVGGDFYDVVKLKNGNFCVLIGDVSGKGLMASFYTARLKGVIQSLEGEAESASEILKKINVILHNTLEKQIYITMSSIELCGQGKISYSRAGHMPLIIKNKNSVEMLTPKGLGIGLAGAEIFNKNIEQVDIELNDGDRFLLITDGINELRNDRKEEFGYKSLIEILSKNQFQEANEIIRDIIDKADVFSKNIPQHDDMTALAFVYKNGMKNVMN